MEASQMREEEVHDLTANSPSYKKLRHEIDPNNMMNPFWDNKNIFVNDKPHRYHDGYTNHTIESHRRLKQMTKSPLRKETNLGNDEDTGEEADEGDSDGKAAMITSAGDAGKEPDKGDNDGKAAMIASAGVDGKEPDEGDSDGKAAMIASAGDDGEEPDLKARSVASTSSLHTYHTDDDVDDLGTDNVNDLVGKLIKKVMEAKSKKSSKRGGKATSNAVRLHGKKVGKTRS